MKTRAMKKLMKELMKVCSQAFTPPTRAWPSEIIPAALAPLRLSASLAADGPAVRHRASSELGLVRPEAFRLDCERLEGVPGLECNYKEISARAVASPGAHASLRCIPHAEDQRAKAKGKFKLDFSGLKRAKTAVRGAKEREALDADFRAEVEQREKALSKAAPNLKALQQFEAVKVDSSCKVAAALVLCVVNDYTNEKSWASLWERMQPSCHQCWW